MSCQIKKLQKIELATIPSFDKRAGNKASVAVLEHNIEQLYYNFTRVARNRNIQEK